MSADEVRAETRKAQVWLPERIFEFALPDCLEVWQPATLKGPGATLTMAWIPPSDPSFSQDPATTGRNHLERIRKTLDPDRIRLIEEKPLALTNLESAHQFTIHFPDRSERFVEILGRIPGHGLMTLVAVIPPESETSDDVLVGFARSLRPYDAGAQNPSGIATRLNDLWVDVPAGFSVPPRLTGTLRPRSPFARVDVAVEVHSDVRGGVEPPEPPTVSDHRTRSAFGYSVLERSTYRLGHAVAVRAYVLLPSDQPEESYSLEEPVYAIYQGWLDCPERVIVRLTASLEASKHDGDILSRFDDWFGDFASAVKVLDRVLRG